MSNHRVATDFDQIIQADRQRKKNEELASQIFGRNKQKESNRKDNKREARAPSLASRIGIAKRSSSTSGKSSPRPQISRPPSTPAQNARQNRLITALDTSNIVSTPKTSSSGITIKGSAAPFVVEARNFAVGTTDADIESAIQRDCIDSSGINTLVSCKIISTKPTVSAELVFNERTIADSIISKYHHQRADGHTLELELVRSGPGSMSKQQKKALPLQPAPVTKEVEIPLDDPNVMDDVEMEQELAQAAVTTTNSYEDDREAAARDRRDRESKREREDLDPGSRRREGDRRRGDRGREEERDRAYDDRERVDNRSYDRRDEPRVGRTSHYGNGVGGVPRSAYGGGYAGGRGAYPGHGGAAYGGRAGYGGRYRGGYR